MPPIVLPPPILLTRDLFRAGVYRRDRSRCVACPPGIGAAIPGRDGVAGDGTRLDAHHLLNRRLWTAPGEEGGYVIENGVTLCPLHHLEAEYTRLSVERLRELAGISRVVLPAALTPDEGYDTWGNVVLPNGTRLRGPLFDDEACQKALAVGGVLDVFTHYVKGHRIRHLPWSEGVGRDDVVLPELAHFVGRLVVCSAKLDGENTSLYADYLHARSLGAMSHPSQSRIKAFHATIAHDIPPRWRVQVENCAAEHTFGYRHLDSLFPVTAVWDDRNVRLHWDEVTDYAALLGLPTAPVLYRGVWDEAAVRACYHGRINGERQEGYIVSLVEPWRYGESERSIAKFVSAEFKTALKANDGVHWATKPVVWNQRRPDSPWAT